MGNPSLSYRVSLAIWDHTVLPSTRDKRTRPALTPPAKQASTWFTYPRGMEGWVDLGSLIVARPGIEPTTAWSQVRRPNRYATKSPVYSGKFVHTFGCQAFSVGNLSASYSEQDDLCDLLCSGCRLRQAFKVIHSLDLFSAAELLCAAELYKFITDADIDMCAPPTCQTL